MRTRGVVAVVVVGVLLGTWTPSYAASGELRVVIFGALALPLQTSTEAQVSLRFGVNLPVSLVSGNAPATPLGVAMFAQWFDATPSAGFGHSATLIAFPLGGGSFAAAAGITTPSGSEQTTFSATAPAETLSGTWTISDASSAGIINAAPSDAVVTFHYDTNPANKSRVEAIFFARDPRPIFAFLSARAAVEVTRNVQIDGFSAPTGTMVQYAAVDRASDASVKLSAIDFGDAFVLASCVASGSGSPCRIGGSGAIAHLSGSLHVSIPFVGPDLVLSFAGSLP